MEILKGIFSAIKGFINNKGVVWIGGLGGLIYVIFFLPKDWFWGVITGILGCLFVIKNLDWIGAWFDKQYGDIKKKFD